MSISVLNNILKFLKTIQLTKVRPLFTLSHRGSEKSSLLIVFSANYIDQSNRDVYGSEGIPESLIF